MRRFRLLTLLAVLAPVPASAEALTDEVPGHAGVTYGDLMKQVIPDLAPQTDGAWKGTQVPALNDIAGSPDQNDFSDGFAFSSVDVLKVKEGGISRLLLITSGSQTGSFAEILAVFDDTAESPRLLDMADIGSDSLTGFGNPATLAIAPGTDLFFVENEHSNSDQSYVDTAAIFLAGGKLKLAADVFSFGEHVCTHEMTQTPSFKTLRDPHAPYRAIAASVTQETTLTDLDCGTTDAARPKPGKRVWRDVFHWDGAKRAYVSKTGNLGRLAKENEDKF